jgi:hypothetical protein
VTVITAQTYADFKTMLGLVGDAATDSATVKTLYYAAWDTGYLVLLPQRQWRLDRLGRSDDGRQVQYRVPPKTLATDFPTRIKAGSDVGDRGASFGMVR